jgi:uncharacterized protein
MSFRRMSDPPDITESIESLARRLIESIAGLENPVVAFSGGVDSSVVAAAAHTACPEKSLAITAASLSIASWQMKTAKKIAAEIGIRHRFIQTDELRRQDYRQNDSERCFFCKDTLYTAIDRISATTGATGETVNILSGTNADDLGDHRPGLKAGDDHHVRTPLADLGIGKANVRRLAKHFGLSNDDLPASPCLASRIAYGVEVTPRRLSRIDRCESWLRERSFRDVRVRCLQENETEVASVEVPLQDLPRLQSIASELTERFLSFGFEKVVIDLEGLRSGKLNDALVAIGQMKTTKQP